MPGTAIEQIHKHKDHTMSTTVEAPVETQEDTKDEQFDRLLDDKLSGGDDISTDDNAVEDPVVDEIVEEEVVEPDKHEGPTAVMATVARQAGVPPQLVAQARDDKQLMDYIDLVSNEPTAPAAVEEFEIDLPEEEYSADDSVRKQFDRLNQHYSGQISKLREELASVAHAVTSVDSQQKDLTQGQATSEQMVFDGAVDEYGAFGKFGELNQILATTRGALYDEYRELKAKNPTVEPSKLVEHVVKKNFPGVIDNQTAKLSKKSIREQGRRKLGSGNARPAPEADPSKDEKADEFFANLRAKRGIKL